MRLLRLEALAPARGLLLLLGGGCRLRRWLGPLGLGLGPVLEWLPLAALTIVVALTIRVTVAIPKAPVITPEGPLVAVVVIAAVLARLRVTLAMLGRGLEGRLWEATLIEQVVGIILGEIIAAFHAVIGPAQALLAISVIAFARLMHLLPIRHDDPAVVLRVL